MKNLFPKALLLFFLLSIGEIGASSLFRGGIFSERIRPHEENGTLDRYIEEAERRIEREKELFRPLVSEERRNDPSFFARLERVLEEGTVVPILEGSGGTYLAKDRNGSGAFVIKPCDEQPGHLHNPKGYAAPFEIRIKEGISPYRAVRSEAFCREPALLCGIEEVFPTTKLCFLSLPVFFSLEGSVKEKLCSVQEYLEDTVSLGSFLRRCLMHVPEDDPIANEIDEESFAAASLLTWLTLDNDAHFGNFRLRRAESGVYVIKKIDGGMCFPETNTGFFNALALLPNARETISPKIRKILEEFPVEAVKAGMRRFGLDPCIESFEERVFLLQRLSADPSMTYYGVSIRLGFPNPETLPPLDSPL